MSRTKAKFSPAGTFTAAANYNPRMYMHTCTCHIHHTATQFPSRRPKTDQSVLMQGNYLHHILLSFGAASTF